MKLIERFGLIKISATNSFLSIISPVLFVSSQTTEKSVIPRLPWISLRKGSTRFLNCALVNSSLNSKSWNLAAVAIAFSRTKNNRLTLILSNALGLLSAVLSPKSVTPWPGKLTTGLIPVSYTHLTLPTRS